jgi:hypothetical protein
MVTKLPWKRKYAAYARERREYRRAYRQAAGYPPDEHDLRPEPATLDFYDDEEG